MNGAIEYLQGFTVLAQAGDEALRFLDIKVINTEDFLELLVRFAFNMLVASFLVRYLYYSATRNRDYLFTYIMISATVFLICFLLENVKLELGFALGLFALFAIIRYRTNPIPIKEMTYLFVVIGLAVVNALANKKISHAELVFTNVAVVALVYVLEKVQSLKHEVSKQIVLEKIELVKPENYDALIKDLKERTGLDISRAEIGKIDFLNDTAQVTVYYEVER